MENCFLFCLELLQLLCWTGASQAVRCPEGFHWVYQVGGKKQKPNEIKTYLLLSPKIIVYGCVLEKIHA